MDMNLGKPGDGQGRLASCCPWGRKESDVIGLLNNNRRGNPQHSVIYWVKAGQGETVWLQRGEEGRGGTRHVPGSW